MKKTDAPLHNQPEFDLADRPDQTCPPSNAKSGMRRRDVLLAPWAVASTSLASCANPIISWRYKLSLAVDTPEGVKSGASVCELRFQEVRVPASGTPSRLTGEAVYLNLGTGRRPLIALLTKLDGRGWGYDKTLSRIYGEPKYEGLMASARKFKNYRGPRPIEIADLPGLVTFADINDPKTLLAVDPNNLSAALDQQISWRSMTLELTDDAVTRSIENYLPWMDTYYHRTTMGPAGSLAGSMNTSFFQTGMGR